MLAMEVQQSSEIQLKSEKTVVLCEECNSKEFKYKCPACYRRTCSLHCVNSHKLNTDCTGKTKRDRIIPLSQFDDSTLISDYNFLEDAKRATESAQRKRVKLCGYHPQFKLPFHLKALRATATKRGTKLMLLPAGMNKREKNQSRYNQRKKSISWTIEWRFNLADVVLLEHGVHESTTLRSVIEKHLQPSPWKGKLRRFCEEPLDNLKLFIRKDYKGSKSPYRELHLDTPLSQLLGGLIIMEYPVIHVFLASDSYNFEVVKDVRPPLSQLEVKRPDRVYDAASPVGVMFKEEEIEEGEDVPETQIIDLLCSSETNACKTNSIGILMNDSKQSHGSSNKFLGPRTERDEVYRCDVDQQVEMLDAKNMEFDFDQELIDAYSFLMEQSNPDDFLDYKEDEADDHVDTNLYFADVEELEEGEIPN